MSNSLISKFDKIGSIASGSKLGRILRHPLKYVFAIGHRTIIYPLTGSPMIRFASLCWGQKMKVALPSGIDIYLLGAKGDDSEVRLSKYLTKCMDSGNVFIDVGAHFGYYSRLAAFLVGSKGKVIACEPSKLTFELLEENTNLIQWIDAKNLLVSSKAGMDTFYEFSMKYAEYNSIDIDQYKGTNWISKEVICETVRESITLDDLVGAERVDFVKIDVEGAEYEVLLGAKQLLEVLGPKVAIEYVEDRRSNATHKAAVEFLLSLGYQSYVIMASGELSLVKDLNKSLSDRGLESDNFIFIK